VDASPRPPVADEIAGRAVTLERRESAFRWASRRRWVLGVLAFAAVCVFVGDATCRPSGPRTPPPAGAEPGRWVYLDGAANTRDAGGYPTADGRSVKHRTIYRSATLSRLSSRGADDFRNLGVKTVIDFRNRLTPWPPFNGDVWSVYLASSVHGCPMSFAKGGPQEEFYIRGVRENAGSFREAFEMLSRAENYPALYHCAAGTDRTGVMSALLLSLLGVDRDTTLADFRLSEQVGLPGSLAAMEALLDHIAQRGGIGAYLLELGVPSDTQERIRALLLEPRVAMEGGT
jgi:protein-tyrosine phosphatase